MLIDTHAHLDFEDFSQDRRKVIERAFLESVEKIINVGCDLKSSKNSLELAEQFENIYASIGIHPENFNEQEIISDEQIDELRNLAGNKKTVAVGEIGLDYFRKPKTKKKLEIFKTNQRESLLKQIQIAQEFNLPIIFHCRMAHDDLINILDKFQPSRPPTDYKLQGTIHCFTGDEQQAKKYLEMGFYLGFNGIIFKHAPHLNGVSGAGLNLDEIIKKTPLERILIETDCPFLTPPQERKKRNEPTFVKYVARRIAQIKRISFEKLTEATTKNANELFKI